MTLLNGNPVPDVKITAEEVLAASKELAAAAKEWTDDPVEVEVRKRVMHAEVGRLREREKYRADVAHDLALHHRMLQELHARLSKLEQMQPKILTEAPRDIDPKFLRAR